jgi:hypothetical protein
VHLLRYPAGAPSAGRAGLQTLGVAALLLSLFCATAAYGGRQFVDIARQLRCNYDLAEVRRMMAFLTADAQPGDIVFTDDWDIFPLYFYHNTHNHYIVGLDPKFTHERRPDLWERYVKISRGQTPTRANVRLVAADGTLHFEQLDVALEDIRSEFGARYVITDRDHRALAAKLSRAPELAELVYPCRQYHACRDATFLVFRIRTVEESARYVKQPPQADEQGRLYLSQLNPSRVEQGWGELALDAAVDNPRLRLRGHVYHRGLGTHAPSTLLFDVPAEFDEFVATLGVDDQTNGEGSVIASVLLDGVLTYRTPILTGTSEPVTIQLPLNGARQIALRAEPTEDGNRFDHVDWADAHFVRQRQPAPAGEMPTTEATLAEQIRRQVQP